ncbi:MULTISPECIES: hypothetical protein [Clostridium]|uniref:Uncharacterized protein n=1 Tax=Clostridium frigoriphilum TaxID=443253 RepID=A0ABU7UWZ6_9CLOT|nr:hypothetical protein [Clostridium sp. DSM 17811]MBU3098757.1 hypothetical protein [Clostridium sp. DSM 17811]
MATGTVNTLLVKSYSQNVYTTGMNSLNNIEVVRPQYVAPVMLYAAKTFYIDLIDAALTKAWITPVEHADTMALKTPEDPQNQPPIEFLTTEVPTS